MNETDVIEDAVATWADIQAELEALGISWVEGYLAPDDDGEFILEDDATFGDGSGEEPDVSAKFQRRFLRWLNQYLSDRQAEGRINSGDWSLDVETGEVELNYSWEEINEYDESETVQLK